MLASLADISDLLDDVIVGLDECRTLTDGAHAAAITMRASTAAFSARAALAVGRSGRSFSCIGLATGSLLDLASLYHDIEMVASWEWILANAGIDPNALFEPISGDYGAGLSYELAQSGPLVVRSSSATIEVAAPGQASFVVPVTLRILNVTTAAQLSFAVDLALKSIKPALVKAELGFPPRLGGAGSAISAGIKQVVEIRATLQIRAALERAAIVAPVIDMFPQQPAFWCSWDDGLVRLAGRAVRRARARQPFLASPPAGFPVAVRYGIEVLTRAIVQEVAAQGARLFSGPSVTSAKSLVFAAGISERKSVKFGCDVASARVKVSQAFEAQVQVRFGTRLSIVVTPVGAPQVDVDISPRIPLLTDWAEDLVEDFINRRLPRIAGFRQDFHLAGVRGADIWLSTGHVTLGLQPF